MQKGFTPTETDPTRGTQTLLKWKNQSIQDYAQRTSMMKGGRGDKDIQRQLGHTSSMSVCSMQIGGFRSTDIGKINYLDI